MNNTTQTILSAAIGIAWAITVDTMIRLYDGRPTTPYDRFVLRRRLSVAVVLSVGLTVAGIAMWVLR